MSGEVIVGIVASIIAFIAVVISVKTLAATRTIAKYQLNIGTVLESEKAFLKSPELLLLHGISPMELAKENISIEEFHYILASLRAGEAYYVVSPKKDQLSYFRKNLLDNQKVKFVYEKYLRSKFFSNDSFTVLVDKYYQST